MGPDNNNRLPTRDGTSQAERRIPELDPGYAQVDERSTRDLLAFAEQYAEQLKYVSVDGNEDPHNPQTWSSFIGPDINLDNAANYARQPEDFTREKAAPFSRPHFALFLTFLELLGHTRAQINRLTHRHLAFFYRDVLKMVRKQAVPDKVHILVDLDRDTEQQLLPVATTLRAGKDSLGNDLVYQTDREIIANRVEIGQISSLYTHRKITGLREACPANLLGGNREESFVEMLRIALGQPNSGDPLAPYSGGAKVNFDKLTELHNLLKIVRAELYMPRFDDLRDLMRWKKRRSEDNNKDWELINSFLLQAGNEAFKISPAQYSDLEANLMRLLEDPPQGLLDDLFNGFPEVENIEDAYSAYIEGKEGIGKYLIDKLAPLLLDDFVSIMKIKREMDNQWEEINRLLEKAGRHKRKNANFVLSEKIRASQNFDDKLTDALGTVEYPVKGGIDGYFEAFLAVEQYFYMSAENFQHIMQVVTGQAFSITSEAAWNKVYQVVTNAHREMIYTRRRIALKRIAQPDAEVAIEEPVSALSDMLDVVLPAEFSNPEKQRDNKRVKEALTKLSSFGVTEKDQTYLNGIVDGEPAPETVQVYPDWERIYNILEVAQRNRENYQEPVPVKLEWRNLYPASDATTVKPQLESETLPRWKTFGQAVANQAAVNKTIEPVPPADFGWALSSPLLLLSEGERAITLKLDFTSDVERSGFEQIRKLLAQPSNSESVASFNPFQVQLSTDEGWLEIDPESVSLRWADLVPKVSEVERSKISLVFHITLARKQPALTPLTLDMHGFDTSVPALRLMLKPVWDGQAYTTTSYSELRGLLLRHARLEVKVSGLMDLHISNDQHTLDAKKPFEPFGSEPAVGSRFYFAHPEIVSKKLESLSFNITWMGVPAKLAQHYVNYPKYPDTDDGHALDNSSFRAKVNLVEGNVLTEFTDSLNLFHYQVVDGDDKSDASKPVTITLQPPTSQGNPVDVSFDSTDVTEWHRYLLWELDTPDFQHTVYPGLTLQKSLELSAEIAAGGGLGAVGTYQINPPYTPKIKSLSLDYSASAELFLNKEEFGEQAMRCFHIEPFGYKELKPEEALPGLSFLPQFNFEGELYIGLRNVTAPQNVSLLFQVAEGSANPDLAPEPVQWSYLSGNRWFSLQQEGCLLADASRGLINSGIVEFSLKPAQASTLLPDNLYWIRAAIPRASQSVCDMVEIHPNAVLATFADNNNAADHLGTPLAAKSITAPEEAIPGVAQLRQPYSSFNGKMVEQDERFHIRVSERLRHKQRALTPWDYERLVLEKFPQIYKAKCLSSEPGKIQLVVIPDIKNRLPFNPFEPKAPADQIRDIQSFLEDKTPPFAKLEVKNAFYIPVMVRCGVRFLPGHDEGFSRRRLNEELNRFLSPWAFDEGADLVIGNRIYANSIINFIDSRDYVDYLAVFKLFTGEAKELVSETSDGYHASTSRADGVLVAAQQHVFDVISDADYRVEEFSGINYMKVELDFTVA